MNFLERVTNDVLDDVAFYRGAVRSLRRTAPIARHPERILPFVVDELAQRFRDAPALLSARETFSYRTLADRTNKYARWALNQSLTKGNVVCVLMPNRPDYLAIWLGVTKVGGIAALLNTNLTGESLVHCIDAVAPKHIIVAASLLDAWETARPHLVSRPKVWVHGNTVTPLRRVDREAEKLSGDPLDAVERCPVTIDARALYIYTSGTTGLPKAANVNHGRIMLASYGFAGVMDTKRTDRMYDCLPMYHTVGGVCAIGSLLVSGGSVFIREKFSAREFWSEVERTECTLFQYIGELCRYLVHAPHVPEERRHRLRVACGNGLRLDIWNEFQNRFRIPHIVEFYAATEGNVMLFNFAGKPGAVGRLPGIMARRFPATLIALDLKSGKPLRNANGFCVVCKDGEIGEAVGRVVDDRPVPGSRFEGYVDAAHDERKIVRDVLENGDVWFRTGDLMRRDERGYFYFVDRIGDTFRWKGENVSTIEVADTIGRFPGITEANVYGVEVPGYDGRAGMAAIASDGEPDLGALRAYLERSLPHYARPLFLRIRREMELTPTFKPKKSDSAKDGFDPARTSDPIYFNDRERQAFVRLDEALHRRIVGGELRL
jgi:fatty-acyl-CoA synthase